MIAVQEREPAQYLQLRSLLEHIVSVIAKKTPNPEINHLPNSALFLLAVDPHDQGRFIGKLGRTIWAIQTIFWYAGLTLCGYSYSVRLLEPDQPIRNRRPVPVKFEKSWDRKKIENFVAEMLGSTLRSYGSYSLRETGETSMTISLTIEKYLEFHISDPNFIEAFETLVRAAGMSQGANIKLEASYA
jgi:predicted RNA-binding protein YlqC (UPF0109 family)